MLASLLATPARALDLLGVNLDGAEWGIAGMETGGQNPAARYGTDYTYPTPAELDDLARAGFNVVRVPFAWERMQPRRDGPLDAAELARMDDLVAHAARRGIHVDLDPHNYGYGYGHRIGSPETPDSSFADLWRRLAAHYAAWPSVIYGLMNEPHDQSPAQWLNAANAAISAIRAAGARQEILVPGTFHENGDSWVKERNAADFADKVVDPGHNLAFEVHQYNDSDQSGGSTIPVSPTIGADRLRDVTAWAEAHGHRLFLGEFGAGPDPDSLLALRNQLVFMQAHAGAWQGGTLWAGGPWWPKANPWSLDRADGVERPQITLLREFAPKNPLPPGKGRVRGGPNDRTVSP